MRWDVNEKETGGAYWLLLGIDYASTEVSWAVDEKDTGEAY